MNMDNLKTNSELDFEGNPVAFPFDSLLTFSSEKILVLFLEMYETYTEFKFESEYENSRVSKEYQFCILQIRKIIRMPIKAINHMGHVIFGC